jgi:hypothetical protein
MARTPEQLKRKASWNDCGTCRILVQSTTAPCHAERPQPSPTSRKCAKKTFCAHCGQQPIEWHNPEHEQPGNGWRRIGHLAGVGHFVRACVAAATTGNDGRQGHHAKEEPPLNPLLCIA